MKNEATIRVQIAPTNPGQFFASCGLLELADRLWPGAEGWFESDTFCLRCAGTLGELLGALANCTVQPITQLDNGLAVKERIAPLRLDDGHGPPLTLDAWMTVAVVKGTPMVVANTPWNFWSGQQTSRGIWAALQAAVVEQLPALVAGGSEGLFFHRRLLDGRFGFDPGPAWNALDVGFSPNEQSLSVESSAIVELLAAVGIQRFRPTVSPNRQSFSYALWDSPLAPAVAAAAASAAVPGLSSETYLGRVLTRGQYAALGYSSRLKGASCHA